MSTRGGCVCVRALSSWATEAAAVAAILGLAHKRTRVMTQSPEGLDFQMGRSCEPNPAIFYVAHKFSQMYLGPGLEVYEAHCKISICNQLWTHLIRHENIGRHFKVLYKANTESIFDERISLFGCCATLLCSHPNGRLLGASEREGTHNASTVRMAAVGGEQFF
eukprot:5663877-Amphidinium_carterae.2